MTLHVRIADGAAGVEWRIRDAVQRIDKEMPLLAIYTLEEPMNGALSRDGSSPRCRAVRRSRCCWPRSASTG